MCNYVWRAATVGGRCCGVAVGCRIRVGPLLLALPMLAALAACQGPKGGGPGFDLPFRGDDDDQQGLVNAGVGAHQPTAGTGGPDFGGNPAYPAAGDGTSGTAAAGGVQSTGGSGAGWVADAGMAGLAGNDAVSGMGAPAAGTGAPFGGLRACGEYSKAVPAALDVQLVVGLSSDDLPTLGSGDWASVARVLGEAIERVEQPGLGLGLTLASAQCDPLSYAFPTTFLGPHGQTAASIGGALRAHTPLDAPGTTPALQGALNYVRTMTLLQPERRGGVLLVTSPTQGCGADLSTTLSSAAQNTSGQAAIPAHVVLVGADAEDAGLLESVSIGATRVDDPSDDSAIAAGFTRGLAALSECVYEAPDLEAAGSGVDVLNLEHRDPDGTWTVIPRVNDAQACDAAADGWYLDSLLEPQQLTVCPSACQRLRRGGETFVVLGCEAQLSE